MFTPEAKYKIITLYHPTDIFGVYSREKSHYDNLPDELNEFNDFTHVTYIPLRPLINIEMQNLLKLYMPDEHIRHFQHCFFEIHTDENFAYFLIWIHTLI